MNIRDGYNSKEVVMFDTQDRLDGNCIVLYWALDIAHYRTPMYYGMHLTVFSCIGHFPHCVIPLFA